MGLFFTIHRQGNVLLSTLMNRSSAFSHLEVIFSFHSECALQIPIDECIRTSNMRGSRIFFRGGGQGQTARKQYAQRFFSVLNLFNSLQGGGGGSNGFITDKTILFKGSGPVQTPTPPPPLWICTCLTCWT